SESERVAAQVERMLFEVPEVASVTRRTGRAENDEHAEGVNVSELEVRIRDHHRPRPGPHNAVLRAVPFLHEYGVETVGRPAKEVEADVQQRLAGLPGVRPNVGQPISHRLDHVMSGVRAQVAVKIYGPDLRELRAAA